MSRFTDDLHLVPGDSPPTTPSGLFLDMGVFTASRAEQQAAVDEWLKHNEPLPFLRLSLEYRGFIPKRPRA